MKLLELEAAHEEERALEEAKRAQENVERKRRETSVNSIWLLSNSNCGIVTFAKTNFQKLIQVTYQLNLNVL